jgi:hypothetical protein
MGANLYINPLHEKQRQQWEPKFEKAARERDRLKLGTPERELAQLTVEKFYDKMYERGYFRDSYNDPNLLWQFRLSWWEDIIPMLDSKNRLSVKAAAKFLGMLNEREPLFRANLVMLSERSRFTSRRSMPNCRNSSMTPWS